MTDRPHTTRKGLKDKGAAADTPKPATVPNNSILKFSDFPDKVYDSTTIRNFLDKVFHAGLNDSENILACAKKPRSHGWYAISEDDLMRRLERDSPYSLYFSTSTFKRSPDDSKLYHRQNLFESLRVVVLDDIGTKVPVSKVPEDFKPSYIIETSPGSFQYGYILAEPVDNVEAARALVQLVYESGLSDEGGKLPNKWVRLPDGFNGKPENGDFCTVLRELNDTVYTPEDIISALHLNVVWDAILEDADKALKARGAATTGASMWSPLHTPNMALNGFIDPVLEWLYENDMVLADNGGMWLDIVCPWGHEHTNGNPTAGYVPLGRDSAAPAKRSFHCFHDSCAHRFTTDLLSYVAVNDGPECGVHDPAAELTTRYVYDAIEDRIRDLKAPSRTVMYTQKAFSTLFPHSSNVFVSDGAVKRIPVVQLWRLSKTRVTVHGPVFDPSSNARIVDVNGMLRANMFSRPEWGDGSYQDAHIEKFMEFVTYLIPSERDREYFLSWLSAKVQDYTFRGAALVMVALNQGMGRSTLADMIMTLLGAPNSASIPLDEILHPGDFNEWREKCFVVVEESRASGHDSDRYGSYEVLKTRVDPRVSTVTINPKYGSKREAHVYTSYLFLSNHVNALALPAGDRRFYVMENGDVPATPEFFDSLNRWLDQKDHDGMPSWGRSVFRWLSSRTVDKVALNAPPPVTEAKRAMVHASENILEATLDALVTWWPSPYVLPPLVDNVLNHPKLQGILQYEPHKHRKHVNNHLKRYARTYDYAVRINGAGVTKPRLLKLHETKAVPMLPDRKPESTRQLTREVQAFWDTFDLEPVVQHIIETLQAAERM